MTAPAEEKIGENVDLCSQFLPQKQLAIFLHSHMMHGVYIYGIYT